MVHIRVNNFVVYISVIITIMLQSCRHYSNIIPPEAGDNIGELKRVLNHYEHVDTSRQKFNATKFLIENMHWHYSRELDSVYSDASILDYDFLVRHIDHAYIQWKESPYAKGLSFDEFTEYLLPYRASQGFGCNVNAADRRQWLIKHIGLPDTISSLEAGFSIITGVFVNFALMEVKLMLGIVPGSMICCMKTSPTAQTRPCRHV